MSDKEVSQLTAAAALAAADMLHLVQGGNSRKATVAQMKAYHKEGWGFYADAASALEANAITIPAGTRTLITIDGGTGSITDYVSNTGIVWEGNEHRGIGVGDSFSIRLSFRAKKQGGAGTAYLLVEQDIGDGTNIIAAQEQALRADSVGHPFTFNFLVYSLATYQTNGARFYITPSVEIQMWAKGIFIRKDFTAPV
jgi:hypothetical protein